MKFIFIERSREKGTWFSLETDEFFYSVDERLLAEWDTRGIKVIKYHVLYPINWVRRTLRFREKNVIKSGFSGDSVRNYAFYRYLSK